MSVVSPIGSFINHYGHEKERLQARNSAPAIFWSSILENGAEQIRRIQAAPTRSQASSHHYRKMERLLDAVWN